MQSLSTERLHLRTYEMKDEKAIYEIINSPGIFETTLNIPYPYPKEQVSIWIHFTVKNSLYKRGYEYGIFSKTGKYIGNVGIVNIDWLNNSAEVTYFIGEALWGQGYATEAVQAILAFAFENLELERIQGRCMSGNLASFKVMQKCGLSYEGMARHEVIKGGKYHDVLYAAILKEDYFKQKQYTNKEQGKAPNSRLT